ncbi:MULTISPECIES: hypothetical protein [unclassified Campylobacter]|nr:MULTISPECIES: hypothetical protein [unclassified Campylobacter]
MSFKIIFDSQVDKFLQKLFKKQPKEYTKIDIFIKTKLTTSDNPCTLPNAKHL